MLESIYTTLYNFGKAHPIGAMVAVAFLAQVASTMPSPTATGFTSTWFYKWLFGAMHFFVGIPRIIITMFPQFGWIFGTNAGQRELQVTDKKSFCIDPGISVATANQVVKDSGVPLPEIAAANQGTGSVTPRTLIIPAPADPPPRNPAP